MRKNKRITIINKLTKKERLYLRFMFGLKLNDKRIKFNRKINYFLDLNSSENVSLRMCEFEIKFTIIPCGIERIEIKSLISKNTYLWEYRFGKV